MTQSDFFIHEFSTGITPEGNEHHWVSKGFTGRYMNMTMTAIPPVVERAIANHGFAVAEGTSSDQPAIIGRVVTGPSDADNWSVIAFVTRGEDEYGRSFGFHRYFLCQGADNLWMLIEWLEAYRKKNSHYPIFNPFKMRQPGDSHKWHKPEPRLNGGRFPEWIHTKTPVVLAWQEQISLAEINQVAEQKANGQLGQIAWALNVEALEQPERFLIIKPASARAEQILQQPVLAPARQNVVNSSIDEQAIKGAIKGLINSNQVNEKLFETLVVNIGSVEYELKTDSDVSRYWTEVFDGQGAANAICQGISNPQMIRLLALRAIILPDKLYQYLDWLKPEKSSQNSSNIRISLDFQAQLLKFARSWNSKQAELFEILEPNLIEGIKDALSKIYRNCTISNADDVVSIDAMIWLLKSQESLWSLCREDLIKAVKNDLAIVGNSFNPVTAKSGLGVYQVEGPEWANIWREAQMYWRNYHSPKDRNSGFLPFAKLFNEMGSDRAAACFYQMSRGSVPANIFQHLRRSTRDAQPRPFGMQIHGEKTKVEIFIMIASPILLMAALLATAFTVIHVWQNFCVDRAVNQNLKEMRNVQTKNGETLLTVAERNFGQTANVILSFSGKIKSSSGARQKEHIPEDIVREILITELSENSRKDNLSLEVIKDASEGRGIDPYEAHKWISAIYSYQKKHVELSENADGSLFYPEKGAGNCLLADLKSKFGQNASLCPLINTYQSPSSNSSTTHVLDEPPSVGPPVPSSSPLPKP